MLLSVQLCIISGVMSNNTFRGRGLCGRFLYAVCKSKVGRRDTDPPPVPDSVKGAYRATIRRMLADQDGGTITLSPEANEIRREYQAHVERRLGPDGDLYLMKDWAGKLTGAMLRIAALLHVADCPTPTATPIPPEVMVRATSIAECLAAHAQAAYGLMGGDQSQVEAKYLWRRIQAHGGQEISKRDLYRLCKGHFRKAEDMEPALSTLSDMGYVREVNVSTGGRPTTKILVNPL